MDESVGEWMDGWYVHQNNWQWSYAKTTTEHHIKLEHGLQNAENEHEFPPWKKKKPKESIESLYMGAQYNSVKFLTMTVDFLGVNTNYNQKFTGSYFAVCCYTGVMSKFLMT